LWDLRNDEGRGEEAREDLWVLIEEIYELHIRLSVVNRGNFLCWGMMDKAMKEKRDS